MVTLSHKSSTSSSTPRPPSVSSKVGWTISPSTPGLPSMRHLLHFFCLSLIALLSYASQHPFSSPSSPSNHQQFSAIGILDVGVGPKYRQYKRYLPIYPLTSLQTTLHHAEPLNIRAISRNTTQHPIRNRETISFAITQSRLAKYTAQSPVIPWTTKEILIPDVTDLVTVTTLAQIANNAYIEVPRTFDWIDVDGPWNLTSDFGWEKNGLRGHVFASEGNETIIISLKGTSPAVFLGGGTGGNDKINDNLLFSCCCAKLGITWSPVCDCCSAPQTCNSTCIDTELASSAHYYQAALEIYYTIQDAFPTSNLWITGHSLGGSVAALAGLTFAAPTVTFCAPGDRLAAKRLHLPQPPGVKPDDQLIWHFGHTADPIYMGSCTGPLSSCWNAGYAMESQCHTGLECRYDTVDDLGWRVNIANHRQGVMIRDVLASKAYAKKLGVGKVVECQVVPQSCVDCYGWSGDNKEGNGF